MKRAVAQYRRLRERSCLFACGSQLAKLALAPGWQPWQVASRFAGEIFDAGSDAGSISCAPWQAAQVATVV